MGRAFLLAMILAVSTGSAAADNAAVEAARKYREAHGPRILREFAELLSIPNVQAQPGELRRTAETIRN